MGKRTVDQALREAGLKRRTALQLKENKEFAKVAVQLISLLGGTLDFKLNPYHGRANLDNLEEIVSEVRNERGRVLDYAVAEKLGVTPQAFSNLLQNHPEERIRYDNLKRSPPPTPG